MEIPIKDNKIINKVYNVIINTDKGSFIVPNTDYSVMTWHKNFDFPYDNSSKKYEIDIHLENNDGLIYFPNKEDYYD